MFAMMSHAVSGRKQAPDVRLEVGVGVWDGSAPEASCAEAVKDLVDRALRPVDQDKFPVRCAVLFSTADWCRAYPNLPRHVRAALGTATGGPVPLIGGSMAMLYCSTEPNPLISQGLVLLLLCSNEMRVLVRGLPNPYGIGAEERSRRLAAVANELETEPRVRLGADAERFLLGVLPGFLTDEQGACRYRDAELHHEILTAFGRRYPLIGGSAADDPSPTTGYQFANDECLESGLALALVETGLSFGAAMGHGFEPASDLRLRVDALADGAESGYEVAQLDGQPAYRQLEELGALGLTPHGRPILGLLSEADYRMIVPLHTQRERERYIRLNRRVSRGDSLHVMDASPEQLIATGRDTVEQARLRAGAELAYVAAIVVFSCIGRFRQYRGQGENWAEAVRAVRKHFPGIPMIGALCAGEFGVNAWHEPRANAMSVSVCCLTRVAAQRTPPPDLQQRLLKAADGLATCKTPRQVMEATLRGAVEAGATGGQICIVDYAIGRILGNPHGWAFSPPDSPHDWRKVRAVTDRKDPQSIGGPFPRALRDWALPVGHDIPLEWVDTLREEEDILTLIVGTLQAVFVLDPADPKFHCDMKAAREGNIHTFLAVPLLGSQGRAIATLQVSFPDGTLLDRESFGLWIGYGQRVGASLERTQEAEERNITKNISDLSNQVLQSPPDLNVRPYAWCDEFLRCVANELGADSAHIRILLPSISGQEFHLVGATGPLGKLRRLTRPVTREGQGSCNPELLTKGGYFSNTRNETGRHNSLVQPIERANEYGDAFRRELEAVQSTALLPIYHGEELLGSFVIHSKQPYFFTERWQRLADYVAKSAGAVLCGTMAAYNNLLLQEERDWQDRERDWMLGTMASATEGTAEARLAQLLERLCTQLKADVGSVYVWHEAAQRLVLHTAHNWHHPREGEAWYALGEGWTGGLALPGKGVSFVGSELGSEPKGTKKYYDDMVPPEHQVPKDCSDPRIGIRLKAGNDLVGVVTFSYYREHADRLAAEDDRFVALLNAVAGLITLAVGAAKDQSIQGESRRLQETMKTVAEHLIAALEPGASWQEVMDDIREGFRVERVSLYHVKEDRVAHVWTSKREGGPPGDETYGPIEPFGLMRDLIYQRRATLVTGAAIDRLVRWPNPEGIRSLFVQPVLDTRRSVRGVLEFVNRIPSRGHPFESFDDYERYAAEDVAQALAAAIDHRDQRMETRELECRLITAAEIAASSLSGAIVMHRLLAPFGSIQRAVDWLELYEDSPTEERAERFEQIREACRDAEASIHEAAEGAIVARQRQDLRTIVGQALRVVKTQISSPRVAVRVTNDCAATVELNVFSFVGALVNVLANAVDAMGEAGTLTVKTVWAADGRHAEVLIHNTGRSLSEEEIARAFAIGFSTKAGTRHLGFGLPLARRSVEEAGGHLDMRSPAEGGVEVRVTLPIAGSGDTPIPPSEGNPK